MHTLSLLMSIHTVLAVWKKLSPYGMGRWLFSYLIRFINPYTGSLGARVQVLEAGYAEVSLEDKKRNHLDCVHAIALTNLGEFTSGMAVLGSLEENIRGIVSHISVDFIKKARGRLRAVCQCNVPRVNKDTEFTVFSEIFDEDNELVSRVDVTWKLGLRR